MSAYLFDFDGTLVDSMPAFESAVIRSLNEVNVDYPENVIEIINPMDTAAKTAYFTSLGVPAEFPQILGRFLYEEYALKIPAKEGVIETLQELKRRGHSLSILTAGPISPLTPVSSGWASGSFLTTSGPAMISAPTSPIRKPF